MTAAETTAKAHGKAKASARARAAEPTVTAPIVAAAVPRAVGKLTVIEMSVLGVAIIVAVGAAKVAQPFLVPVVAGILLAMRCGRW